MLLKSMTPTVPCTTPVSTWADATGASSNVKAENTTAISSRRMRPKGFIALSFKLGSPFRMCVKLSIIDCEGCEHEAALSSVEWHNRVGHNAMFLFRRASWLLVLLTAASCSGGESPETLNPISPAATSPSNNGPSSNAPTPPRGERTISGVVTERTASGAQRPFAAQVNAWVDTGRFGYSYMWANGPRTSGADGRYELTALPESARVIVQVYKEGYFQQCAAPPVQMTADAVVDVELIPRALVSASPDSVTDKPGFRSISGVIYENTPSGRLPGPGVFVDYEHIMDSPGAITLSDANGRYLLCGIPNDLPAVIGTSDSIHRVVYVEAPPGQTTGVDLVLP